VVDAPPGINVKAWVKPEIVAEVKYYEKTKNRTFRFPDFVRKRDDKTPDECKL
jgi:bifunctional non-homologous end joining protein LigD